MTTRESRTTWAMTIIMVGVAAALAGILKWWSTEPDLNASAKNVATAFGQVEGASGPPHYITSQPIWAYGGLAIGAALLLIGVLMLVTRPAETRAWTDARA